MTRIRHHVVDNAQASAIACLFSSGVIRQFGKYGRSPIFARLSRESGLLDEESRISVADFLNDAYRVLSLRGYRSEHIYKTALLHNVLLGKHSLRTATMLTEFRVADSRADIVILNGTSTVYEVKSELDGLHRLTGQVDAYRKAFARVNVIADECHVNAVVHSVPTDVGVLQLSRRRSISVIRDPLDAPYRVVPAVIFDSLRRGEAEEVLRLHGIEVPPVPNTQAYRVIEKLFATLSPTQAHEGMVRVLRKTRSLLGLAEFLNRLPHSLRASAMAVPLRKQERARVIDAMNIPMDTIGAWI